MLPAHAPLSEPALLALRAEYQAFLRPGRVLLTGHSHQAWPDCARAAQAAYFDDAAEHVDDKWERVLLPKAARVGRRILERLGCPPDDPIAFAGSTHELVFRLLSALPGFTGGRPRVVTTSGEFHSLHRQLCRLREAGAEVVFVDAADRATLAERLLAALAPGADALLLSAVLFEDAYVVELPALLAAAVARGVVALVDAYHAFNVVPLALGPAAAQVYITAGGYKYAQFGEGLCFLRAPRDAAPRPLYTGWFADFGALGRPREPVVGYGPGGERFAGSTFDGSALYRAEAVLDLFDRHGLSVARLRGLYQAQTERIIAGTAGLPGLALRSPRAAERRGGFVALSTPRAGALVAALRARGVYADARGDTLRLGPAPYLSDAEIDAGVAALAEALGGAG